MTPVDTELTAAQLIPGTRYDVVLSDCCVSAEMSGVFLSLQFEDWDKGREYPDAIFDFGRVSGHKTEFWATSGENPTPG